MVFSGARHKPGAFFIWMGICRGLQALERGITWDMVGEARWRSGIEEKKFTIREAYDLLNNWNRTRMAAQNGYECGSSKALCDTLLIFGS